MFKFMVPTEQTFVAGQRYAGRLSEKEQWSMWKDTGCFLAGTKVSTA